MGEQDLSAASDWLSSVDLGNSDAGVSLVKIMMHKQDLNIVKKEVKEIEQTHDVEEMHFLVFNIFYQDDVNSVDACF